MRYSIPNMSELSPAYLLAEHIHATMWLRNDILPDDLPEDARIHARYGTNDVERVVATSRLRQSSEPAYETLTKTKRGTYYFQATPGVTYTGENSLGRHVITQTSG